MDIPGILRFFHILKKTMLNFIDNSNLPLYNSAIQKICFCLCTFLYWQNGISRTYFLDKILVCHSAGLWNSGPIRPLHTYCNIVILS